MTEKPEEKAREGCAPEESAALQPFSLVIFGGSGDLSRRMILPALYHIFGEGRLDDFRVTAFGLPGMTDEKYRDFVRESVMEFLPQKYREEKFVSFAGRLGYISSAFDSDDGYRRLAAVLKERAAAAGKLAVVLYLAVPPDMTGTIVRKLGEHGINELGLDLRIVIEKPFGRDLASAVDLNRTLREVFHEREIYRIDHYLGKETVQNILFFRFANSIFEPLWNNHYIDNVQITVAENLGIAHRGAFYERAGVVRDIVQNHILQLVGLVAMEPPAGFTPEHIREEKQKVLNSLRPFREEDILRDTVTGQYGPGVIKGEEVPGYRSEKNVAADSVTPTFFAARFHIDNWRWAGVPFYVRTGKRMGRRATEMAIQFRQPPLRLFTGTCNRLEPNILFLGIAPKENISLKFGVKALNTISQVNPVNMVYDYAGESVETSYPTYRRLLMDCIKGDPMLFVRQDGVEAMWSVVDPIVKYWEEHPPGDFPNYSAGTWGPESAQALLRRDERQWLNEE